MFVHDSIQGHSHGFCWMGTSCRKLQLASFEWHLFNKCLDENKNVITAAFDAAFPTLLQTLRKAIGASTEAEETPNGEL